MFSTTFDLSSSTQLTNTYCDVQQYTMALLGMRISSFVSSSGSRMSMSLVSQTAKPRINGISTINYRSHIAMTTATRNYYGVVSSSLYKYLQSISVGRRHSCIFYAQLSSQASKSRFTLPTSSAKVASKSSSAAAATKLQERQRLKWRIIARVAYYLRVSCSILYILFFQSIELTIYMRLICSLTKFMMTHLMHSFSKMPSQSIHRTNKHIHIYKYIYADSIPSIISLWYWISTRYNGLLSRFR